MSQIGNYPFVRVVIPFATGIAAWSHETFKDELSLFLILFTALMFVYSLLVLKVFQSPSFTYRFVHGLVIYPAIFCAGYLAGEFRDPMPEETGEWAVWEQKYIDPAACAVVVGEPLKGAKTYSTPLRVFVCSDSGRLIVCSMKIMAWMEPDEGAANLLPGDTVFFKAAWEEVKNSGNPSAFNYKAYLNRKGIVGTVYLSSGAWTTVGYASKSGVAGYVGRIRRGIANALVYSNLGDANKGLALALLTGMKDELDHEVNHSFAAAGAVHVLCVSGLHVGIIFILINGLFGYLQRFSKYGRVVFVVLSLSAIWSYALVTGLPPSVNRSAIMFSFILIGKLFKRKNMTLNSVAASAFILLVHNPNILFHIGFQLSYLAVFGIITLFPSVSSLWNPNSSILMKVRDIIGVSICAQLLTFPLTVALFGTFPNYFLLTNILVIPITSLVIFSGIAFLATPLALIRPLFLWTFDSLLSLMRCFVSFVENIPGSSSDGLYISSPQVWILLGAILSLILWCNANGKYWLIFSLGLVLCSSLLSLSDHCKVKHQKFTIFYYVRNGTLIDVVDGKQRFTLKTDSGIIKKDEEFASSAFRLKKGVFTLGRGSNEIILEENQHARFSFERKSIMVINGNMSEDPGLQVNVALITGAVRPCDKIFLVNALQQIVLDGSVKTLEIPKWKSLAEEYGVNVWDTREDGAFLLTH